MQARVTQDILAKDKVLLKEDKPQLLVVSELVSKEILLNGKLLARDLVQVKDESSDKRYWVGGYQAYFKAKDLDVGKPVDIAYSAATDELNIKVKPEYRLKQQLRKQALEEVRQQFNVRITDNQQQEPKEIYYGKFLKSGSNSNGGWVLIKLDDGKLVKINDIDVFNKLNHSVRGEQVCISLLREIDVAKPTMQRSFEVVETKSELAEILNKHHSNSQEFIGKFIRQTEFKYSNGKPGYRTVVRDVETGESKIVFTRQKQQLETYALFGFKISGLQIIKKVDDFNNLPPNTRNSVTGQISGYGETVIRGKSVFYCSFKTHDGEVRKYGESIRELVESGQLSVGKYCTLLTVEKEATIMEKQPVFISQNVTSDIDQLTERLLEGHKHNIQQSIK
jgi:hypothetical protein